VKKDDSSSFFLPKDQVSSKNDKTDKEVSEKWRRMFDKRLQALLKEHKLSVTDLAKKTGISRTTIQSWISGTKPSVYELDKLCTIFNMTLDELVFNRKPKNAIEEFFTETLIHTGNYKIQISKLTKKDEDD
jgi:transcriptional regulator with XRE-family HTH domain